MRDAEGRWIEGRSLNWEHIPPRVEAVIAERIDRLPEDAQLLLRAASVEGDEFTAEVTARVLGLDRAEVLRQLSGRLGEEHKLVRGYRVTWLEPDRRSLSRYRFRHALFHDYLYQRLDAVEQARLHQLTGEALEELHGTQAAQIAVQLAHHYDQAGLAAKAIEQLHLAAEQAMRLGAYRVAVANLKRKAWRCSNHCRKRLSGRKRIASAYSHCRAARPCLRRGRRCAPTLQRRRCVGSPGRRRPAGNLCPLLAGGRAPRPNNIAQAVEAGRQMLARPERTARRLCWPILRKASPSCSPGSRRHAADLEMALSLYRSEEDDSLETLVGFNPQALILAWGHCPVDPGLGAGGKPQARPKSWRRR